MWWQAGRRREVWTLELGVDTPFLRVLVVTGRGLDSKATRRKGAGSDWSEAQAAEADRDPGKKRAPSQARLSSARLDPDPPGFQASPASRPREALFCTPLSRPGRASVPAAAPLWTLTPRL